MLKPTGWLVLAPRSTAKIRIFLGVVAVLALGPGGAHGWENQKVTVVGLTNSTTHAPIQPSRQVLLLRLPDARPVKIDEELRPSDVLYSTTGDVTITLDCSGRSQVHFSKFFHVAILDPEAKDCAFDMNGTQDGAFNFSSNPKSTGNKAQWGEIVLASESTDYEVRFVSTSDGIRPVVNVYEGSVEVTSVSAQPAKEVLGSRMKLFLAPGNWQLGEVQPEDRVRTAAVYASVNVSMALRAGAEIRRPEEEFRRLVRAHAEVLDKPEDGESRVGLAMLQAQFSNALFQQVFAQLDRADEIADRSRNPSLKAASHFTRAVAFSRKGSRDQAIEYRDKAVGIDPQVVARLKREVPGLPQFLTEIPVVVTTPITVTMSSSPSQVSPGQPAQIVVRVALPNGEPVAGASVKIAANGGAFGGGSTQITGQTDARGIFATSWSCRPCASAYEITAEVSGPGFATSRTSLPIEIRP